MRILNTTRRVIDAYNRCVIKYPLIGMSITSGFGMGLGNAICQGIMYKRTNRFDNLKVLQYASFGLLISVHRI